MLLTALLVVRLLPPLPLLVLYPLSLLRLAQPFVLVTVVVGWRHETLAEIVTTVVAVSLVLTVAGLIMDRRQGPNIPVPIESAE